MSEQERIEKLAEEIAEAEFCAVCFGLVPKGEACPNGCDEIPPELFYFGVWKERRKREQR